MSEPPVIATARVIGIEPYEKGQLLDPDDDRTGHIDLRYRLERGDDDVIAVADVRVYFKRTDISLDALISSALARGHEALLQIAQHYKPAPSDSSPEQLWR